MPFDIMSDKKFAVRQNLKAKLAKLARAAALDPYGDKGITSLDKMLRREPFELDSGIVCFLSSTALRIAGDTWGRMIESRELDPHDLGWLVSASADRLQRFSWSWEPRSRAERRAAKRSRLEFNRDQAAKKGGAL
jgi:hypothetical protein